MPSDEPLSESEARKFIASEVNRLLIRYMLIVLAIIGIPNVIAVIVMWNSVMTTTQSTAKDHVKGEVTIYLEGQQKQLNNVVDLVKQRAQDLDKENFKLAQQVAAQSAVIEALTRNSARLTNDAEGLRKNLDILNSPESERAANIVRTIQQYPEAKELLDQFRQVKARDDAQDQELDWLGQAGQGGVWNALFNYLSVAKGADAQTLKNWRTYHEWMGQIAIRAEKRLADSQRSVATTRPVAVVH
jgi:hypothetical protein